MSARPATRLRLVFLAASAALLVALALVSTIALRGASARTAADADVRLQEDLRTALWRMESRVGSMLELTAVGVGARVSETFYSNVIDIDSNESLLTDDLPSEVAARAAAVADEAYFAACDSLAEPETDDEPGGPSWVQQDYGQRRLRSSQTQIVNTALNPDGSNDLAARWTVGPSAPLWCTGAQGGRLLVLARRVESPLGVRHRADALPWADLRATLLGDVDDLFPAADVVPVEVKDAEVDLQLAAVPVRLEVDLGAERARRRAPGATRFLLWFLGLAWLALVTAIGFGWVALRASVRYGDQHRRFTHAVTHELRTPLTTFRMYCEMLHAGMVPEGARAEYLATLESESARLSGLVENVLRYARLEEGAGSAQLERVTLGDLVERHRSRLERIAGAATAALRVDVDDGATPLDTDPDAVLQVLSNLVENACKYGLGEDRRVLVEARARAEIVEVDVVDFGPGLAAKESRLVFEPFERAGRTDADPTPGVGLGLALARDLARALRGDLVLVQGDGGCGARFRLSLPRA
ncbi:MAG: HAMP domain-containing sensor histidine kinase [Planctomycetota bacterium]